MTKYTQSQNKATQKYIKANYDEVRIRIPKGKKAILKEKAREEGKSLNQYVISRLDL